MAVQKLRNLAGRNHRWSHQQCVNVIVTAADLRRRHLVFPRHTAEVGPDAMLNFRLEIGGAILVLKIT